MGLDGGAEAQAPVASPADTQDEAGSVMVDLSESDDSTDNGIEATNAGSYDEETYLEPDEELPPQAHESATYLPDEVYKQLPSEVKSRMDGLYHESQEAGRHQVAALEFAKTQKAAADELQKELSTARKELKELRSVSTTQQRQQLLDSYTDAMNTNDTVAMRDAMDKLTTMGSTQAEIIEEVAEAPAPAANIPTGIAAWADRNASWFNPHSPQYDAARHEQAMQINNHMINQGYDPNHPNFMVTLDKAMAEMNRNSAAPLAENNSSVHNQSQSTNSARNNVAQPVLPAARVRPKAKSNQVRLNASQIKVAKAMGVTPAAYAKELVRLGGV